VQAIKDRVANPVKFSAGKRFIASANINAPIKVMSLLGYPVEESESPDSDQADLDILDASLGEPHGSEFPEQAGGLRPFPSEDQFRASRPETTSQIRDSAFSAGSVASADRASANLGFLEAESQWVSGGPNPSSSRASDPAVRQHSHRAEVSSSPHSQASFRTPEVSAPDRVPESIFSGPESRFGPNVSGSESKRESIVSHFRDSRELTVSGHDFANPVPESKQIKSKKSKPALVFSSEGDPQLPSTSTSVPTKAARKVMSQVVVPETQVTTKLDSDESSDLEMEECSRKRKGHRKRSSSSSESPHKRRKKRATKDSSSDSDSHRSHRRRKHRKHKRESKKSKTFLIEEEDDRVSMTKEGFASFVQKLLDSRASTSSEDESGTTIPGSWKKFRELVLETHPDIPLPEKPRTVFRTAAVSQELVAEQQKLPLFPGTVESFEVCEDSIKSFPSKEGLSSQPLKVGQFFPAPAKFPAKYWEAADGVLFTNPSSRPQNLPKDLFQGPPGEKETIAFLTEKDLKEEEKVCREMTSLWSLFRWSLSSTEALLELDSLEELKAYLQTVLVQQNLMVPYMEERLLQQLSNIILRRRDAILDTKEAQRLQEATLTQMRASPLIGPELMSLPQDTIFQEQEIKSSRSFISKMIYGAKAWASQPSYTRQAPRPRLTQTRPSAAAGSAAQLAAMPPPIEAQQWPQYQQTSSFKPRKPQFRGSRGRGTQRGSSTLMFKSGPSARGKTPFRRGRGRRQ